MELKKSPKEPGNFAREIALKLDLDAAVLKVLCDQEGVYLTDAEGLKIINASEDWLTKLKDTARTLRNLRLFGFTGKTKPIIYQNELGFFSAQVRPLSEWASIWALFANRKNARAAKLLSLLVVQGVSDRIASIG